MASLSKKNAVAILALMLLDGEEKCRIKRKNRRVWVRGWIARRQEMVASHRIVRDLATEDPSSYKEYLRIHEEHFKFLFFSTFVSLVSPLIKSQRLNLNVRFDWLNTEICLTLLHEMLQVVDTRRNLLHAMLQK